MLELNNVTKTFGTFKALDGLTMHVPKGAVYGLVGPNGAGKSTAIRCALGVYRPESGTVTLEDAPIYENPAAKARVVYIPDELYFLPQSTLHKMAQFYRSVYPSFSMERFEQLVKSFGLDKHASLNAFSKGMKRQAATILGLSTMAEYLLFDETFDGLDPAMRRLVKKMIYNDILERGTTAIITSHSLRELEDTCDQLALLHRGGIVFESDVERLKTSLYKAQVAFAEPFTREKFEGLDLLSYDQLGSVATMILRGDREANERRLRALDPILCEFLPLNLEEVFIYETEALGYKFEEEPIGGDRQ
jgi:ABC-2 type transport system ATP-binding protein